MWETVLAVHLLHINMTVYVRYGSKANRANQSSRPSFLLVRFVATKRNMVARMHIGAVITHTKNPARYSYLSNTSHMVAGFCGFVCRQWGDCCSLL